MRGESMLVDFYRDTANADSIEFGIMQPVFVEGRLLGAVYFELDPHVFLYPLVKSWPESTETAESLLVRKDGDHALFLTPLRHRSDPPLTVKIPLDRKNVPAVRAIAGKAGFVRNAVDYRGEPVVAYHTEIDRTPWQMVTKIDRQEALREIQQLGMAVSVAMLLVLLASTAIMWGWLKQMQSQQIITDLKLVTESNQLAATIEAIPDLLFEMDIEGRYFAVHDSNDRLLAQPAAHLLNRTVYEVMPSEQADAVMLALQVAAEKGSSRGTRISLKTPGGSSWFELSVARKQTPPGQTQRLIVISRNITGQKRAEAELELHREHLQEMVAQQTSEAVKARIEAERANQAKSIFLANMSHELRTPMHAILSFASLGSERSKDVDDAQVQKLHQFFDRITQSGNRLMTFLNDLLDLAKLEAGKMVLGVGSCDMQKVIGDVCDELKLVAEVRGVELDHSSVKSGLNVICDRIRIGQVLGNLVSNAVKFSPAMSTVHIRSEETTLPGGHPAIAIRVEDEGLGIPADELEIIFDKFVQSTKTSTGAGGTGLGLSICREIVALHGGTIRAENNAERGASFIFTLPTSPVDAMQDAARLYRGANI